MAPIVALFTVGAILDRNCVIEHAVDGKAGTVLVWRIETQRCGNGPAVSNVLIAPHGKTLALAASTTGTPKPLGIERTADGTTLLLLEGNSAGAPTTLVLPLKSSGRPSKLLVLANGQLRD